LCRKVLNQLESDPEHYVTAYLPNPYLTPNALILAVAGELGLDIPRNAGAHRAMEALTRKLIELSAEGKRVILCIDEAQAMPDQTLEAVRLITNLETEKRKLLHVVLFGQPELDEHLAKPAVRQLRQRITFSYTLEPIDRDGLDAYINHRLIIAGNNGQVHFQPKALNLLYRGSGGIPRLINILAHKTLLLGYGKGTHTIEPEHVKLAIQDTEGAHHGGFWQNRHSLGWLIGGTVLFALAATIVLTQTQLLSGVSP
jgi:MSHA biogenesis protein MshM